MSSKLKLPSVRVAACNVSPVFLDTQRTVEKTIILIETAAKQKADLVVFPEAHIPGFPIWSSLCSPIYNNDLFVKLAQEAVYVNGSEIGQIRDAARTHKVFVSLGFNEKSRASAGCLWNSMVLIDDRGRILNHHRKMVPTFYEKLTWANGDGAGLKVVETERLGKVGGLICGENGNSLARFTLMAQAEQLHISSWSPCFPTKPVGTAGNFDHVGAMKIRVAAHSFEAKCFSVACSSYIDKDTRDFFASRDPAYAEILDNQVQGGSMFFDPSGAQIGEEIQSAEGVVYCDMDLSKVIEPKQLHDFAGGYLSFNNGLGELMLTCGTQNRFDIFSLKVNRHRPYPVVWDESHSASGIAKDIHGDTATRTHEEVYE